VLTNKKQSRFDSAGRSKKISKVFMSGIGLTISNVNHNRLWNCGLADRYLI
jgi:hypothetical protein